MSEYVLSKEEKVSIIETHLRTLGYSKYNLQVTLMEEQSVPTSNDAVASVQAQIASVNQKIGSLTDEINSLNTVAE
jgi:hypothetical protein